MLGWVLGPPQAVVLVLGSSLGVGPDFGLGWVVPRGAWSVVGVVLLSTGDIGGVTVMVILAWRAAGRGLVQVNCGVRLSLGNVDLAGHRSGV